LLDAGEESQFHDRSGLGIVPLQLVQGFVDGQQLITSVVRYQDVFVKLRQEDDRQTRDRTSGVAGSRYEDE